VIRRARDCVQDEVFLGESLAVFSVVLEERAMTKYRMLKRCRLIQHKEEFPNYIFQKRRTPNSELFFSGNIQVKNEGWEARTPKEWEVRLEEF
jgi:hypothetical protein